MRSHSLFIALVYPAPAPGDYGDKTFHLLQEMRCKIGPAQGDRRQRTGKARFIAQVFDGVQEAVYASPPEGGAQTAIATVARRLGKRATIFVAARTRPHPRTLEAARLGAKVVPIGPGYLSVVQSRASEYCRNTGASLIPFGAEIPGAIEAIATAARLASFDPNQVWCADITYLPMRKGFLYLVAIMDWFTRKVLAWRISNTLEADFCVEALNEAIHKFGPPEIMNTDQGSQFTCAEPRSILRGVNLRPSPGAGAEVEIVAIAVAGLEAADNLHARPSRASIAITTRSR